MKVTLLILILLLKVTVSYNQAALTQAVISADYSTLKLENTKNYQLSERLLRFHVATNISQRTDFFLNFSQHNIKLNKSNYSTNYPIGIGFTHNFNIKQSFCLSFSASLNYTKFIMLKDNPYIKKYKHVFNIGGGTSFLYRLPILHHNLFIYTGVFFNMPLKKEVFKSNSNFQILNTYPFLGVGYRLSSSAND